MKELLPKLVLSPTHPLKVGYLVASRPQPAKSSMPPSRKASSLSAEQKAETKRMWQEGVKRLQEEAREALSGAGEAPPSRK